MSTRLDTKKMRILLLSANPLDSRWLKQLLSPMGANRDKRQTQYNVSRGESLTDALVSIARHNFDAILVDLGLATTDDLKPVSKIIAAAPHVPVIMLAGINNDAFAIKTIRLGAQDCLFKDSLDARVLSRTIKHAIERKRAETTLAGRAGALETAHTRLERQASELRSCMAQLDHINHELEDFTYIASHDLKEPLHGMSSYCEILLEDYRHKLDADGKRRLNTVIELCDRLENLIEDLLTYCRVGRKAQAKTRLNLNNVVINHLKMLQPTIERRKARVRMTQHLPTVYGNATLIGMVFSNLISNGLKFNEHQRPRVEIGWLPTKPNTFYVKDNGIGIAKEHHEVIFNIFRRLHSRKKYDGTGAGLTIVKKIVDLHGGRIWLESAPGEGTMFFFTLSPSAKQKSINSDSGDHNIAPPHWDGKRHPAGLLNAGK